MLKELKNPRQHKNELSRRWFSCENMDLIVWFDEHQEIAGFQLAYNKHHSEHALTWEKQNSFRHHKVDDGEGRPGKHKGTPILVPDGKFDSRIIAEKFKENSRSIDQDISDFVYKKLLSFK